MTKLSTEEGENGKERVFVSPRVYTVDPPEFYVDRRLHAIWFALTAWDDTVTYYDLYRDEPNDRSLVVGMKYAELERLYDSLYNYDGSTKKKDT